MGVDIVIKLIIAMYGMIKELAGEDVFNEAMNRIKSPTVSKEDFEKKTGSTEKIGNIEYKNLNINASSEIPKRGAYHVTWPSGTSVVISIFILLEPRLLNIHALSPSFKSLL